MRIISANLNGIRSAASKGFFEWIQRSDADIVCVQELKAQLRDIDSTIQQPKGYHGYFHCAERKGYSGVGIYTRTPPIRVTEGVNHPSIDIEARYIRADFEHVSVISVYVPSGSSGPERQAAKFDFLNYFSSFLDQMLNEKRPFIVCGDWNIAHCPIDIKNWKGNQKNSGFLPEERTWLDKLYANGWVDVFRKLYPEAGDSGYTWWSQRGQAYAKNVGWRIDLQIATQDIAEIATRSYVYKDEKFSDHAPLIVDYEIKLL